MTQRATAQMSLAGAGQLLQLAVPGHGGCAIQITGAWIGTILFQGSVDGNAFDSLLVTPLGSTSSVLSAIANGTWLAPCNGLQIVQCMMSGWASGSAVVTMASISAAPGGGSSGGSGGGGAVTIADGAAVTIGSTTDAAVVTDTSGSVIAYLRGLVKRLLAQVLDYDTGAGTSNQVIFGISLPASGGPVGVSSTNPLPIAGFFKIPQGDTITYTATSGTVDTYLYKLLGATVGTVTVTWTDSTHATFTSVVLS